MINVIFYLFCMILGVYSIVQSGSAIGTYIARPTKFNRFNLIWAIASIILGTYMVVVSTKELSNLAGIQ